MISLRYRTTQDVRRWAWYEIGAFFCDGYERPIGPEYIYENPQGCRFRAFCRTDVEILKMAEALPKG